MKRDFMDWVLFVITIAAAVTGIAMVIYKITGHSPTIEEVLLVFASAIAGLLVKHMTATSKFEGYAKAELTALRRDMEEAKRDLKWLVTKSGKAT